MVSLLLLTYIIGAVHSQTWAGTFTTDSSCSTSACCCLTGQVKVISTSSSTHTVTSSVAGVCGAITTFLGVAYTNGYSGWLMVGISNDTLALSSDSQNITVTNTATPACSGRAFRSSAMKQHSNILMIFTLALVGMGMSALKI